MTLFSIPVTVAGLEPGDILRRNGRTVVISSVSTERVGYTGTYHEVSLVKGIDVATQAPVQWMAVPDQKVSVVR